MWMGILKSSNEWPEATKLILFLHRFLKPVDERSHRFNVLYLTEDEMTDANHTALRNIFNHYEALTLDMKGSIEFKFSNATYSNLTTGMFLDEIDRIATFDKLKKISTEELNTSMKKLFYSGNAIFDRDKPRLRHLVSEIWNNIDRSAKRSKYSSGSLRHNMLSDMSSLPYTHHYSKINNDERRNKRDTFYFKKLKRELGEEEYEYAMKLLNTPDAELTKSELVVKRIMKNRKTLDWYNIYQLRKLTWKV